MNKPKNLYFVTEGDWMKCFYEKDNAVNYAVNAAVNAGHKVNKLCTHKLGSDVYLFDKEIGLKDPITMIVMIDIEDHDK